MGYMQTLDTIKHKLSDALNPIEIEVIDESHLHAGHVGARDGGQSHFAVKIVSEKFKGVSPIKCHKLIYGILATELENGVHALRITALAPSES